jgi:hypothetical protein
MVVVAIVLLVVLAIFAGLVLSGQRLERKSGQINRELHQTERESRLDAIRFNDEGSE